MIKIDALDHSGKGITRIDNKIGFIENALPDENVEIIVTKNKKNYFEGKVYKYLKKSDKRINPACPFFDVCGGCDIMHLSYKDQLEFKQTKVKNILKKYLKENIKINDIVFGNSNFNYRNKVTLQVNNKIGLYQKNSNQIIEIDNCLLCSNIINNAIKYLNKLELDKINQITLRSNDDELMVIIDSKVETINIEKIKEIANSIYIKHNNKYELVYGKEYIIQNLGELKYIVSPDSFFQINNEVAFKLYSKIKEETDSNKKVLDLYCGTGSIGIFISKNNEVIGIEKNKYAIMDANKNKELNNISNINFICGDSGEELFKINFNPDIIVVDPPRNGLNKETIDNLLSMNPKKIIYVSCDPMTLARDLNILKENYIISEVTPFDMFPNTRHVESVVLLERR